MDSKLSQDILQYTAIVYIKSKLLLKNFYFKMYEYTIFFTKTCPLTKFSDTIKININNFTYTDF